MPKNQSRLLKVLLKLTLGKRPTAIEESAGFPRDAKDELEKILRKLLLGVQRPEIESNVYRESYDEWHRFQLQYAQNSRDQVYPVNTRRYRGICRLIGKGKRVLEVGCGEGLLSIAIAKAGNEVIGTDVSGVILVLAENNRRREACKAIDFKRMDACDLQFPCNSFDCVVSKSVLEHLRPKDVRTHLREVQRVLKNGGGYFLITPNRYAGWPSEGLHLKTYTYRELGSIFGSVGGFVLRSPLLPPVGRLNIAIPIQHKVFLEGKFHRLRMTPFVWLLVSLEPVIIIATKLPQLRIPQRPS